MPFGVIPRKFIKHRKTPAKHTMKAIEKKVNKLVKKVKVEIKYATVSIAVGVPITSTAFRGPAIARGVALNQRVGAACKCIGLEFNYYLFNTAATNATGLTSPYVVRVLVFCDKQNNQVLPILTDIFDSDISVPGEPFFFTTMRNREYQSKYHILYDKIHVVGSEQRPGVNSLGDNNPNYIHVRRFLKSSQAIKFAENDSTGLPAGNIQGQFYVGLFSTLPAAGGIPSPVFNGQLRVKYTDM